MMGNSLCFVVPPGGKEKGKEKESKSLGEGGKEWFGFKG